MLKVPCVDGGFSRALVLTNLYGAVLDVHISCSTHWTSREAADTTYLCTLVRDYFTVLGLYTMDRETQKRSLSMEMKVKN